MRHQRHTVRFGRQRSHYKATMRHLVTGLIINKSITTTKVKAKETSRLADKLVTLAKNNTVSSRRMAYSLLQSRDLVSTLFNEIGPLFNNRNGGYTRVMITNKRHGDNAEMAILEFVEKPKVEAAKKKEKKKEKGVKPEVKADINKKEEPKREEGKDAEPQKEKIVKKKEQAKQSPEPVKGELKKITQPPVPKKSEKPEEPKPKTGLFKKLFGHKKEK